MFIFRIGIYLLIFGVTASCSNTLNNDYSKNEQAALEIGPIPLVKYNPRYPAGAKTKGIEGWTIVEYTVNTEGRTENIRVVESNPQSIFDTVSVKATKRFKYRPQNKNGVPIKTEGVQTRFDFSL